MVKKVFGLASVALAAFVCAVSAAACSSTTLEGSSAQDATSERPQANRVDGGDVTACYTSDAVDHTRFTYKQPNVQPGVCTQADVQKLVDFIQSNQTATFADLQREIAKLPAACAACVIGDVGAAKWTPILTEGGAILAVNSSGCIELVSGKGEACGKAHRQWDQCIDAACLDCDDNDLDSCQGAVQEEGQACGAATDALAAACGTSINAYLEECRRFDRWITRQCVNGTPSDAGADADADAQQ